MENANNFYYTKDQLANSPSRKCGIDSARELSYRQQAANFIQDMGQRLQVSQLCINTAIVYMHRFYVQHSFTEVHRNNLSIAALFLAAKVEEQPRKLEHVIKVAHLCLHKDSPPLDVRSEAYQDKMNEVVFHENILLQALGFVLAIEHPHTYVVKVCQLVKASKDLAQTSYIMATTSLHMTTMCLQYKPTVVACVCIHLACKWSNYMIEPCSEGREWFYYVDRTVTMELLEKLTQDYITILERSPHRFKKKFGKDGVGYHGPGAIINDPSAPNSRVLTSSENKVAQRDASSPGPSYTDVANYDYCQEFDEKRCLKYDSPDEKFSTSSSQALSAQPSTSTQSSIFKHQPSTTTHQPVSVPSPASPSTQPSPVKPNLKKPIKVEKIEPPAHSITLAVYREKKRMENKRPAAALDSSSYPHQSIDKKPPQNALHEQERVPDRVAAPKHEINHQITKIKTEPGIIPKHRIKTEPGIVPKHRKEYKTTVGILGMDLAHFGMDLTHSASDPVVMLERVDVKQESKMSSPPSEIARPSAPVKVPSNHERVAAREFVADPIKVEKLSVIKANESHLAKSKHLKHKVNSSLHNSHSSGEVAPQGNIVLITVKDAKSNGSKEAADSVDKKVHTLVEVAASSRKNLDVPTSSKHERREKHKSKHSSHSKDKHMSNHSEQSTGIKVKIRKDKISLSGVEPESSQKYSVPNWTESIKMPLKIKIPKPPMPETPKVVKPENPASIKLVITKDKSGSGSYSTSHKNERESRKRSRTSPIVADGSTKNSYEMPTKYSKVEHSQKGHHGDIKHNKISRHSHHHTNAAASSATGRLQHPVNDSSTFHTYNTVTNYHQKYPYHQLTPPPPPPQKLRGYGQPVGKTNLNPPLPPPLPPPQTPPPPPPED